MVQTTWKCVIHYLVDQELFQIKDLLSFKKSMLAQLSWLVKVVTRKIDLFLYVFLALCQTKPGWSLTKLTEAHWFA